MTSKTTVAAPSPGRLLYSRAAGSVWTAGLTLCGLEARGVTCRA